MFSSFAIKIFSKRSLWSIKQSLLTLSKSSSKKSFYFTIPTLAIMLSMSLNQYSITECLKDKEIRSITKLFITEPESFDVEMNKIQLEHNEKQIFVLFYAEKNAETGESWCSDCIKGEPIIISSINHHNPDAILVYCNVKHWDYRKKDTYPYRHNPLIKLNCVPTLHRWENGKSVGLLNDKQCQDPALVKDLIINFNGNN
jgi:hypothetical protein